MEKIFAEVLEEEALKQFKDAMALECNVQGALMPDAHTGYTLPIGAVIKSKDMVFPAYVGYDIGCGVCAAKLNITKDGLDLEQLRDYIVKNIPLGFQSHQTKQDVNLDKTNLSRIGREKLNAKGYKQIGTLGGGNHFIEIGESENDGKLWIVIHSGSRGFGHGVAEHYMKEASALHAEPFDEDEAARDFYDGSSPQFAEHNPKGFQKALNKFVEKAREAHIKNQDIEGHYGFHIHSDIGIDYLNDMDYALKFALANRSRMIDVIVDGVSKQTNSGPLVIDFINRNHNHAELKDGYVIHRKGATHAEEGMMGVIPANMRDGAFIVRGLGNEDSMCSSSHGAGRVLSRSQARKTLNVDEFIVEMEKIITNHTEKMIDEAPEAYKNIFEVMELQKDLVEIIDRSIPILNIKG